MKQGGLVRSFVRKVYADHNDSRAVRENIRAVLSGLRDGAVGLNVGAGFSDLHPALIGLDVVMGPGVGVVGSALCLPFRDESCAVVVSQEVVEHLGDAQMAVLEMARVLKRSGRLYLQVPFIIGYHPGPTDYWRFTREGAVALVARSGLMVEKTGRSVGGGTGAYRILVELSACLAAAIVASAYRPVKGIAAVMLLPLKWLDRILEHSPEADRIAGGYFVVARKP